MSIHFQTPFSVIYKLSRIFKLCGNLNSPFPNRKQALLQQVTHSVTPTSHSAPGGQNVLNDSAEVNK